MPQNTVVVTANFEWISYRVTVISEGTGATGGGMYAPGATVTITAGAAPEGQTFRRWTTTSGVSIYDAYNATASFVMPSFNVAMTANFEPKYTVTVLSAGTGATGGGEYFSGTTVSIAAGTAPATERFVNWTTESDGVTFANANNTATSFNMPANAVTVTANFEPNTFRVTVVSAGAGAEGSGDYYQGTAVNIKAGTHPNGIPFFKWETSNNIIFANAENENTVFIMPSAAVTVTATFGGKLTDSRDGKAYRTTTIGGKRWMAENLNYTPPSGNSWAAYGRLYDWNTAMAGAASSSANPSGVQGVCPIGWHLPSREEWNELETAAGGSVAGTKLKSTSGWYNNGNGTDDFIFSALPGGTRSSGGGFSGVGDYGGWWSATENGSGDAINRLMYYDYGGMLEGVYVKGDGFSVRCRED